MDDKDPVSYQYLIPRNVNARFTFFEGFGWKELFLTLLGGVVGIIVFFICFFISNIMIRLLIAIFFPALAFLVTRQNPRTGISLLNLIKDLRQFVGQQKLFLYYHGRGRD